MATYSDRSIRVMKLFKTVSIDDEAMNDIENYLQYAGEAIDKMSEKQLDEDFEEFLSK